jgi:hypothetical protein
MSVANGESANLPTLQLCGDELDRHRVMAWMLFPTTPEYRATYVARCDVKQKASIPNEAIFWQIFNGPSRLEIQRGATVATKRGSLAGDLLGLIYERHKLGLDEPSLNKAIASYMEFALTSGQRFGDRKPLLRSESQIRESFDSFRPVAHLWAAYRLMKDDATTPLSATEIYPMLSLAQEIGSFATSFIPKRTRPPKPIIAPEGLLQIIGLG